MFYVAVTRAKNNLYFCYRLGKKSLSPFVKESSGSVWLDIPTEDIEFLSESEQRAEERQQASLARKARSALRDYYGTAARIHKAAWGEFEAVGHMSDSEAISEAERLGLI